MRRPSAKISVESEALLPGTRPADVRLVADRRGKSGQVIADEQRFDDEHVRQVHAAFEGIVQDEHVAGLNGRWWKATQDRSHSIGNRSQMHRNRQSLSQQASVRITHGRREVHIVLEHA